MDLSRQDRHFFTYMNIKYYITARQADLGFIHADYAYQAGIPGVAFRGNTEEITQLLYECEKAQARCDKGYKDNFLCLESKGVDGEMTILDSIGISAEHFKKLTGFEPICTPESINRIVATPDHNYDLFTEEINVSVETLKQYTNNCISSRQQ